MHYVYILQGLAGQHFYVGHAEDLRARLTSHNAGRVPHTSKFRPWTIKIYLGYANKDRAIAFEKYLKSPSGRAFAAKRLRSAFVVRRARPEDRQALAAS